MDKDTFLKSMSILESALSPNNKITKGTITIYWGRLRKYGNEEFKKAVIRCLDDLNYFPKIAELKNMLEGNPKDEAELAWIYLIDKIDEVGHYQSVSFPEYPAVGEIVEKWGGWSRICDMTFKDETFRKIEFIKLYPIMKKRGDHPRELAGQFEIDNSNKGYNEETMLGIYGRKLDGKKVDRKLLEASKSKFNKYLKKE